MADYQKIFAWGLAVSVIAAGPSAMAKTAWDNGALVAATGNRAPVTDDNGASSDDLYHLEQQRQDDSITAQQALEASAAYRHARDAANAPRPLGTALPACLASLQPACLLQEAAAQAHSVDDADRRDWVLADIVAAFAQHGAQNRALQTAVAIHDPRRALRALVSANLIIRPVGPADGLIKGLLAEDTSQEVWLNAAERRDWQTAFDQIASISEARFRSVAWSRFARLADEQGRRDMALEALAQAEEDIPRIRFTYGRGFAQYEASKVQHAFLNADRPDTLDAWRAALHSAKEIALPHLRADMLRRFAETAPPALSTEIRHLADRALAKVPSKLRRVFVLTGPTKTEDSVRRAAALAAGIDAPLERARAFLRLSGAVFTP